MAPFTLDSQYRDIKNIGGGNESVVLEAWTDRWSRVAVKCSKDPSGEGNRLVQELARIQQLRDAGDASLREVVVEVLDQGGYYVNGDISVLSPYYTMHYMPTVADYRRDCSLLERLELLEQCCRSVSLLHGLSHRNKSFPFDCVHRDIKGANLFVRQIDGALRVVIGDFGSAEIRPAYSQKTHSAVGTWGYMPPDQMLALRGEVQQSWDVFALALIIYETLQQAERLPPLQGNHRALLTAYGEELMHLVQERDFDGALSHEKHARLEALRGHRPEHLIKVGAQLIGSAEQDAILHYVKPALSSMIGSEAEVLAPKLVSELCAHLRTALDLDPARREQRATAQALSRICGGLANTIRKAENHARVRREAEARARRDAPPQPSRTSSGAQPSSPQPTRTPDVPWSLPDGRGEGHYAYAKPEPTLRERATGARNRAEEGAVYSQAVLKDMLRAARQDLRAAPKMLSASTLLVCLGVCLTRAGVIQAVSAVTPATYWAAWGLILVSALVVVACARSRSLLLPMAMALLAMLVVWQGLLVRVLAPPLEPVGIVTPEHIQAQLSLNAYRAQLAAGGFLGLVGGVGLSGVLYPRWDVFRFTDDRRPQRPGIPDLVLFVVVTGLFFGMRLIPEQPLLPGWEAFSVGVVTAIMVGFMPLFAIWALILGEQDSDHEGQIRYAIPVLVSMHLTAPAFFQLGGAFRSGAVLVELGVLALWTFYELRGEPRAAAGLWAPLAMVWLLLLPAGATWLLAGPTPLPAGELLTETVLHYWQQLLEWWASVRPTISWESP